MEEDSNIYIPDMIYRKKKLSENHKRNISLALKGRLPKNIKCIIGWNKGRHHSEETKKKIGLGNKGRHHSEETRKKISEAGKKKNSYGFLGKKHSEKWKIKMSQIRKGRHKSKEHKRKIGLGNIGKKRSEEAIKRISLAHKNPSEETRKRISLAHKNPSEETRKKMRMHRAKQIFPLKDTSIEIKIQNFLQQLGIEYYTHRYMKEIDHSYQCDIFIPSMNMVIECDGNYWHKYPTGTEIDHIRTKELIEKGFKILRLWEHEIKGMDFDNFNNHLKKLNEKVKGG